MSSTPSDRLYDLFIEVTELAAERQAERLEEVRLSDPDLHSKLQDLLKGLDRAESVFELFEPSENAGLEESDPTHIGRYKVVERIGEGGMGVVYRARIEDGYTRDVAIKLVKRGMDSEEVVRRFRYEQQILANLEHTNIARLYDAGVAEDGRPFLVMELIDGTPISEFVQGRPIDERLRMFMSVCEAVTFAHQHSVVHRDLKPSNIMVSASGEPKLLDFGIAKMLDLGSSGLTSFHTRTGQRRLTPAYASPEQMTGGAATTASDIYSLGIILYEMLTGERPFKTGKEDEDRSTVTKPSDMVEGTDGDDTIRLKRRIKGDLDNIILTALRVEPERRYQSADQFLDDIKRHLEGLPVSARPASPGYRMSRFVARNKAAVVGATLLAALTIGYGVFYAKGMAKERDAAKIEAERASAANDFIQDLFWQARPEENQGDTLTVYGLLDKAIAGADSALAGQPRVAGYVYSMIGDLLVSMGQREEADELFVSALRTVPQDESHVQERVNLLEGHAVLLVGEGNLAQADSTIQVGLELTEGRSELLGKRADLLKTRGSSLVKRGAYREAISVLRESLSTDSGSDPSRDAHVEYEIAISLGRLGVVDSAEVLFEKVIRVWSEDRGVIDPDVANAQSALGNLLTNNGRFEEADALHRAATKTWVELYGWGHPEVSTAYNNLSINFFRAGQIDSAVVAMDRAVAIFVQAFGDQPHPDLALSKMNAGYIEMAGGNLEEAERRMREALADFEKVNGGAPTGNMALCLKNLGTVMDRQERYPEAEAFIRRSRDATIAVAGPQAGSVGFRTTDLASNLLKQGRLEEARKAAMEGVEFWRGREKPAWFRAAEALQTQIGIEREMPNFSSLCEVSTARADSIYVTRPEQDQRDLVPLDWVRGECLLAMGQDAAAADSWTGAWTRRRALFGDDSPEVSAAWSPLEDLLTRTGQSARLDTLRQGPSVDVESAGASS